MSTTENEAPVRLRASKALSVQREQPQSPGAAAAAPQRAGHEEDESISLPALGASGLAVLLGAGWLLQRRQRLAHRKDRHSAPASVSAFEFEEGGSAAKPLPPLEPAAPLDAVAQFRSQFEDQPQALQPQQSFPAPLEHRPKAPSVIGVASQKRLIKWLMWMRTIAGGVAVLAAIAIVVFWSIELIDRRAGETGLTRPLLVVLLSGWVAWWGAGQLANQLHRAFFGRVHPKFDN